MQAGLLAELDNKFEDLVTQMTILWPICDQFEHGHWAGRWFRLFQPNFLPATKCSRSAKPREGTSANYSITADMQTG